MAPPPRRAGRPATGRQVAPAGGAGGRGPAAQRLSGAGRDSRQRHERRLGGGWSQANRRAVRGGYPRERTRCRRHRDGGSCEPLRGAPASWPAPRPHRSRGRPPQAAGGVPSASPHLLAAPLGDHGRPRAGTQQRQARGAGAGGPSRNAVLQPEQGLGAAWAGQRQLQRCSRGVQGVHAPCQGRCKRRGGAGCRGPGRERRAQRQGRPQPASRRHAPHVRRWGRSGRPAGYWRVIVCSSAARAGPACTAGRRWCWASSMQVLGSGMGGEMGGAGMSKRVPCPLCEPLSSSMRGCTNEDCSSGNAWGHRTGP